MKTRQAIAALVLGLACVVTATAREWTDTTGEHKIEGEFTYFKSGMVQLKKSDGSSVGIPMRKLCEEDQKFIRDLLIKKQAEKRAEQSAGKNRDADTPFNIPEELGGEQRGRGHGGPGMGHGGPGMGQGGPGMGQGGPGMGHGGPGMGQGGPGMGPMGGLGAGKGHTPNTLFHVTMTVSGKTREFSNPLEAFQAMQQLMEAIQKNPQARAAFESMAKQQQMQGGQRGGQGGRRGGPMGGPMGAGPGGGERGPRAGADGPHGRGNPR